MVLVGPYLDHKGRLKCGETGSHFVGGMRLIRMIETEFKDLKRKANRQQLRVDGKSDSQYCNETYGQWTVYISLGIRLTAVEISGSAYRPVELLQTIICRLKPTRAGVTGFDQDIVRHLNRGPAGLAHLYH